MATEFTMKEFIPLIKLDYDVGTTTWSIAATSPQITAQNWVLFSQSTRGFTAYYDASIDYSALMMHEETAFLDAIKETSSFPLICSGSIPPSPLFPTQAIAAITLISTTPFQDFDATSFLAGFSASGDDMNQLLYRKVENYSPNIGFGITPQLQSSDVCAGTNAFAVDKIFIRKILSMVSYDALTAPHLLTDIQLIMYESYIQSFGLKDTEGDLEHLMRMKRNSRLGT